MVTSSKPSGGSTSILLLTQQARIGTRRATLMSMPQPITVWMVHQRTALAGVKGTMSLDDRTLLFVPEGGRAAETVLPVRSIVRAHRARGTPVLEVVVDLPDAPSVIGFYFVQPPALAERGAGVNILDRFMTKRRAVIKLKVGSTAKRDQVDRWVSAIKSAKG
jgi:hypothetical protein